ncbi:MAG TPA: aldo/keto reductase [Candidatus Saccharimonadales bacterium]|nr:aldo/keto reductase [Candidatus Saccharimonadales bacterium]
MADQPYVTLNNGVKMPQLGLGVWQASNDEAEAAVRWALEAGYRLIDTAAAYGNEAGVGRAIGSSGIPREELFITTKLWNADHGYDEALRAFDKSMNELGLDYLDLYLIHWPVPAKSQYKEAWQAFEKLHEDKRIRAIGVSNFLPEHLDDLITNTRLTPAVNQIELHPYLQQHETRDFCAQHEIQIESWSPIGRGGDLLQDPVLKPIAETHGKSTAQVIIRWHLQHGFVVIPKSVHQERIIENFDVFDFELSAEEMQVMNDMHSGTRLGPDPATANFT